jgi:uncharacterized repeat protein (TIGR02543 family)
VEQGKTVTKPDDPAKAGNTFAGWYKEAAGTNPWNFATDTVTAATTLYAKWTPQIPTYTVTFNTDGGSEVGAQTVVSGEKASKPADPAKEGYAFAGWHKEAAGTTPWNFAADRVARDTTIYAKWTRALIVVTFTGFSDEEIVLNSNGETFSLSNPGQVRVEVSAESGSIVRIDWYEDGVRIYNNFGMNFTVSSSGFLAGPHTITAVVLKDNGVVYSKTLKFRVTQ